MRILGKSISLALLLAALATPAHAVTKNACYVQTLRGGQFITQTGGETGTVSVYSGGKYKTTIYQLNQPAYVTSDLNAVVRGYDQNGLVC